jgi:hypothetical protein
MRTYPNGESPPDQPVTPMDMGNVVLVIVFVVVIIVVAVETHKQSHNDKTKIVREPEREIGDSNK